MFNRIKENGYVQKFLEIWNNPRYRSLIILGLYAIFFIFVIAYIRSLNNNSMKVEKVDTVQEYKSMDNYQYRATIKNEDVKTLIGKVDKQNQILTYNNSDYYIVNDKIYTKEDKYIELEDKLLDFDIWKFNPKFISELLEKGEVNSKTEFTDGTNAKSYLVKVSDFIKLYFGDETEDDRFVNVTVYQSSTQITKVELDITNIYNMGQYANSSNYIITLEYEFVGQISPIVIEIEE